MPGKWSPELARQLRSDFVSRIEMMDWERCIVDDFHGDSIDTRWSGNSSSSGIIPTLQNGSPSRILLDTGATSGSTSYLEEGSFNHWSAANQLTVRVIARINSIANIDHRAIFLDLDASNRIIVRYDTSAGDTGWKIVCTAGGVSTLSANILAADTDWNTFDLSVKTGSVRARANRGALIEVTTNIPSGDLKFRTFVGNSAAFSKTSEINLIQIWPEKTLF